MPLFSGSRKMGPRQEGVEETTSCATPLREKEDGPKTGRSGGDHKLCHSSQGAGRWAQDRKEWRRPQVVPLLSGRRKMGPRQEGVEETTSCATPLREKEDGPKTGRSGGDHKSCHSSQGTGRWAQDRKEWRRPQVMPLLSGNWKMGPRQEGVEETTSHATPLREQEDGPKTGRSGGDHKLCHSSQGTGRWAQDRK